MPNQFGGMCFNNRGFKDFMNNFYNPAENMKRTVDFLKAKNLDLTTIEWGDYQPILAQPQSWPTLCPPDHPWSWADFKDWARADLSAEVNSAPLSQDEPDVIPPTKCALLDAAVRKCFNSIPPIPIKLDITDKLQGSPNADKHAIDLVWDYGKGGIPTLLNFTLFCPYIPPAA
jgi:hypothetical protein